jgi:putrescine importer
MARLQRSLSLGAVVLFGIAYMTPIIVLGTFGILAEISRGAVPAAYVAASLAMLFTALSYARMAGLFPVAGSAYSYVRRSINDHLGFIAGWSVLLDYLFLPMAIWLIGAAYLHSAFPEVPQALWVLTFILVTSVINVIGLRLAKGINGVLMLVQFLVLLAFVALCVHYVLGDASKPLWSLEPFIGEGMNLPLVMAGAAVACYSFLGFDAVSTLTEETHEPQRTIPRAILLITLIGGLIFVVTAYFVQLAHPSTVFESSDAAAYEIARNIGGDVFVSFFLIGLIVGQLRRLPRLQPGQPLGDRALRPPAAGTRPTADTALPAVPSAGPVGDTVVDDQPGSPGDHARLRLAGDRWPVPGLAHRRLPSPSAGAAVR